LLPVIYNYCVFEAGDAPPPVLPTSSELTTSLNTSLGIQAGTIQSGTPQLIYLGYDSYVAVYQIQSEKVAFDLRSRTVSLASDLKSNIVTPDQYAATVRGVHPEFQGYQYLPVPIENMADPNIPPPSWNNNNCGPTSGAMISEYYKQIFGCSLDNWPLDEENLYTDMQTNQRWPNGTWPGYGGSGFVFYAALRGYTFSTSYDMPTYYEYTTIQNYINAIHPILILFDASAPYAQWHWCAIKGYQGGSNVNYLIVNNPWGNQDYVSWEANFSYVWISYLSPN